MPPSAVAGNAANRTEQPSSERQQSTFNLVKTTAQLAEDNPVGVTARNGTYPNVASSVLCFVHAAWAAFHPPVGPGWW
jgi:hypothetical protein